MERNPNHGTFVLPTGYRDLGWQLYAGNSEDVKRCQEAGHKTRDFDNSIWLFHGDDRITICDKCKTVYHIDSSD